MFLPPEYGLVSVWACQHAFCRLCVAAAPARDYWVESPGTSAAERASAAAAWRSGPLLLAVRQSGLIGSLTRCFVVGYKAQKPQGHGSLNGSHTRS